MKPPQIRHRPVIDVTEEPKVSVDIRREHGARALALLSASAHGHAIDAELEPEMAIALGLALIRCAEDVRALRAEQARAIITRHQ